MAQVISADEIKKTLPRYSPSLAEKFHHESARKADKLFASILKTNKYNEVILLNGGTASGKSEFLATQLSRKKCMVFDPVVLRFLDSRVRIILRVKRVIIMTRVKKTKTINVLPSILLKNDTYLVYIFYLLSSKGKLSLPMPPMLPLRQYAWVWG